jgi:hypothetical protein
MFFLITFAILYGLIFINYIDVITNGSTRDGYHLWLVFMYFLPFAILSVIDKRNWKIAIGLGLLTSLMNDLFYGLFSNILGKPYDLVAYFGNWLIPGNTFLFSLNLGFAMIPVQSWTMAVSIYARLVAVFFLLGGWTWIQRMVGKENSCSDHQSLVDLPLKK